MTRGRAAAATSAAAPATPPARASLAPRASRTRPRASPRRLRPAQALTNGGPPTLTNGKPIPTTLRVFPYGVSRSRLERAIRTLRVSAFISKDVKDSDVIIALKANYRKEPSKLQEGITRNIPTYVIKSNTYVQIESVLREIFKMPQEISEEDVAISQAEEAIEEIMNDTTGGLNSLELAPQNSFLRRLQHQIAENYKMVSESIGAEPNRRVQDQPAVALGKTVMFITFEGVEGAGKTTQIARLAARLREAGRQDVLTTREPGDGPLGQELRRLALHPPMGIVVEPRAELLIMLADRAQHVGQVIRPHLEAGGIVICDRYADSSLAYQGYGRGLDLDEIAHLNDYATGGLQPDLTFLLDLDPAVGLARQRERTVMEEEALPFHQRIRAGFLALAEAAPERFVVLDAARPPDAVHEDIWNAVSSRLPAL